MIFVSASCWSFTLMKAVTILSLLNYSFAFCATAFTLARTHEPLPKCTYCSFFSVCARLLQMILVWFSSIRGYLLAHPVSNNMVKSLFVMIFWYNLVFSKFYNLAGAPLIFIAAILTSSSFYIIPPSILGLISSNFYFISLNCVSFDIVLLLMRN